MKNGISAFHRMRCCGVVFLLGLGSVWCYCQYMLGTCFCFRLVLHRRNHENRRTSHAKCEFLDTKRCALAALIARFCRFHCQTSVCLVFGLCFGFIFGSKVCSKNDFLKRLSECSANQGYLDYLQKEEPRTKERRGCIHMCVSLCFCLLCSPALACFCVCFACSLPFLQVSWDCFGLLQLALGHKDIK